MVKYTICKRYENRIFMITSGQNTLYQCIYDSRQGLPPIEDRLGQWFKDTESTTISSALKVDATGKSVLHQLAEDRSELSLRALEYILKQPIVLPFVNLQESKEKNSPLLIAAMRGNIRAVKLLITHGGDLILENNKFQSPFSSICAYDGPELDDYTAFILEYFCSGRRSSLEICLLLSQIAAGGGRCWNRFYNVLPETSLLRNLMLHIACGNEPGVQETLNCNAEALVGSILHPSPNTSSEERELCLQKILRESLSHILLLLINARQFYFTTHILNKLQNATEIHNIRPKLHTNENIQRHQINNKFLLQFPPDTDIDDRNFYFNIFQEMQKILNSESTVIDLLRDLDNEIKMLQPYLGTDFSLITQGIQSPLNLPKDQQFPAAPDLLFQPIKTHGLLLT